MNLWIVMCTKSTKINALIMALTCGILLNKEVDTVCLLRKAVFDALLAFSVFCKRNNKVDVTESQ